MGNTESQNFIKDSVERNLCVGEGDVNEKIRTLERVDAYTDFNKHLTELNKLIDSYIILEKDHITDITLQKDQSIQQINVLLNRIDRIFDKLVSSPDISLHSLRSLQDTIKRNINYLRFNTDCKMFLDKKLREKLISDFEYMGSRLNGRIIKEKILGFKPKQTIQNITDRVIDKFEDKIDSILIKDARKFVKTGEGREKFVKEISKRKFTSPDEIRAFVLDTHSGTTKYSVSESIIYLILAMQRTNTLPKGYSFPKLFIQALNTNDNFSKIKTLLDSAYYKIKIMSEEEYINLNNSIILLFDSSQLIQKENRLAFIGNPENLEGYKHLQVKLKEQLDARKNGLINNIDQSFKDYKKTNTQGYYEFSGKLRDVSGMFSEISTLLEEIKKLEEFARISKDEVFKINGKNMPRFVNFVEFYLNNECRSIIDQSKIAELSKLASNSGATLISEMIDAHMNKVKKEEALLLNMERETQRNDLIGIFNSIYSRISSSSFEKADSVNDMISRINKIRALEIEMDIENGQRFLQKKEDFPQFYKAIEEYLDKVDTYEGTESMYVLANLLGGEMKKKIEDKLNSLGE